MRIMLVMMMQSEAGISCDHRVIVAANYCVSHASFRSHVTAVHTTLTPYYVVIDRPCGRIALLRVRISVLSRISYQGV